MGSLGCGGRGISPGEQFQYNIEGMVTVGDAANLQFGKAGIINGEQQMMTGTGTIEVTQVNNDSINVNLIDLNVSAQTNSVGTIMLQLTPQSSDNTGTLFKKEFGIASGLNMQNAHITVVIPDAGASIALDELEFFHDITDVQNTLPVLGKIPVINFLFNNVNKRAQIDSLVLIITPKLSDLLED